MRSESCSFIWHPKVVRWKRLPAIAGQATGQAEDLPAFTICWMRLWERPSAAAELAVAGAAGGRLADPLVALQTRARTTSSSIFLIPRRYSSPTRTRSIQTRPRALSKPSCALAYGHGCFVAQHRCCIAASRRGYTQLAAHDLLQQLDRKTA